MNWTDFIKSAIYATLLLAGSMMFSCNDPSSQAKESSAFGSVDNTLPKDEQQFFNKVKAEKDWNLLANPIQRDAHIAAFNKYALDSLKKIHSWEMSIEEINDKSMYANSFAHALFNLDTEAVYNVDLIIPETLDPTKDSLDTHTMHFTYTILTHAPTAPLQRQLAVLQSLHVGDDVIVSGSITHIDENLKPNFATFYIDSTPWNLDLLITDIKKKNAN